MCAMFLKGLLIFWCGFCCQVSPWVQHNIKTVCTSFKPFLALSPLLAICITAQGTQFAFFFTPQSVDFHFMCACCWLHLFFTLAAVRKSNPIKFYRLQIVTVPTPGDWVNGRGQRDTNKQACRWITQHLSQQQACHRQRRHRPSQPWQFGSQENKKWPTKQCRAN